MASDTKLMYGEIGGGYHYHCTEDDIAYFCALEASA